MTLIVLLSQVAQEQPGIHALTVAEQMVWMEYQFVTVKNTRSGSNLLEQQDAGARSSFIQALVIIS